MNVRNSCLYECTVMHRRIHPREHQFLYRIFLFLLDLDELPALQAEIPLFSVDNPNLYSLRKEDYFQFSSGGLRENIGIFLESEGFHEKPHRIRLLTLPRLLGYTFNPVSIFFCDDEAGQPLVSVIQVGNTFGELKPFLVPLENGRFHARKPKNFYVSPFSGLDLAFDFRFDLPGNRLGVWIDDYAGEQKTLISTLTGSREELTTGNLARLSVKYPLVTLKVILLIHWEALRLWRKRVPHHRKEEAPHLQQGAFRARPSDAD
jgi:DUF1365 family protein